MPRIKQTRKSTAPINQDRVKEILKCKDPLYFIKTYCKVSHPKRGLIPFETYPYQDECVEAFKENRFVIVNKSRQLGLSTVSAAYSLWLALFHKEKNILVIATDLAVASNFQKKVFTYLDNLPSWLVMPKVVKRTVKELRFSNGSQVKAIPTTPSAGRSEAVSLLILDETAHIDNVDDIWLGLSPTLSCVAADTLVLTDNGFQKIEDFFPGDHKPGDYFEMKMPIYGKNGMEVTSHGYVSPNHETHVITTKHGHEVEVTPIHPLYAQQRDGSGKMIQAQDLKIGDHLRIECNMNKFGNYALPDDVAYILGGYTAKGWLNKGKLKDGTPAYYGISIKNTDNDFRDFYLKTKSLAKQFVVSKTRPSRLQCYSKDVASHFISLGINPKARCFEKEIPWAVLQGNKQTVANYLSGLFDGDGSCTDRGIILSSTSHTLLKQTQQMLLNFGIVSNISKTNTQKIRDKDVGKRVLPQGKVLQSLRQSWILTIPHSQYDKFANEIGFKIQYKQQKCFSIASVHKQDDYKLFSIPSVNIEKKVKEIIGRTNRTFAWLREEHGLRLDKCFDKRKEERYVTQFWLSRFKSIVQKELDLTEDDEKFFNENLGTFFWDPIVSIQKSTNVTYDFTVPETHSFLQNCILGSNTGGSTIMISTPNGVGNLFHKIWVNAHEKKNDFCTIELPWTVHPEHDEKWFETESAAVRAAKGERGIAQEFLCSFLSSGDTFIKAEYMEMLEKHIKEPIAKHPNYEGLWIWEYPEPGRKYLISLDIARGDAADFSAALIFDIQTDEVVAEYKGKIPPDKFADMAIEIGQNYNMAMICPENNGPGLVTATELKKKNYPNLFYEKLHKNIYASYTNQDVSNEICGISTQAKNREEMLAKLENVLRNGYVKIPSKRYIEELKTFIWKNNRAQAMKGYNDDLVMCSAIGISLFETSQKSIYDETDIRNAMLAALSTNNSQIQMSPWGMTRTVTSNNSFVPPIMTTKQLNNPNNPPVNQPQNGFQEQGRQDYRDPFWNQFSWLLK